MLNMIYPIFDSIPGHRVKGRCIYLLGELLTISPLTYMSGGEDYVDMSIGRGVMRRSRVKPLWAD